MFRPAVCNLNVGTAVSVNECNRPVMLTPADSSAWTRDAAAHLLNRAGFGGTPADIDKLHALGREKAVDSLIDGSEDAGNFPMPGWTKPEAQLELAKEMMESRRSIGGMAE